MQCADVVPLHGQGGQWTLNRHIRDETNFCEYSTCVGYAGAWEDEYSWHLLLLGFRAAPGIQKVYFVHL